MDIRLPTAEEQKLPRDYKYRLCESTDLPKIKFSECSHCKKYNNLVTCPIGDKTSWDTMTNSWVTQETLLRLQAERLAAEQAKAQADIAAAKQAQINAEQLRLENEARIEEENQKRMFIIGGGLVAIIIVSIWGYVLTS